MYPNQWSGWEQQLLQELGAPVNSATVGFLSAWGSMEGSDYSYNPLNITAPGQGVQDFSSPQAGIEATANFMQHGYQSIITALQSGNPWNYTNQIAQDLHDWSDGAYNKIKGASGNPTTTPSGGGSGWGGFGSGGTGFAPGGVPQIIAADWSPLTEILVVSASVLTLGFFLWKAYG